MVSTRLTVWDPRNRPRPEDQSLPSLGQTQSDPLQVGKTVHNVGRLAYILGLPIPTINLPDYQET